VAVNDKDLMVQLTDSLSGDVWQSM